MPSSVFRCVRALAAVSLALAAAAAAAQAWPSRPITMVMPYAPAGLSTTICWPSVFCMAAANTRVMVSPGPPGA